MATVLENIERLAKSYSDARDLLSERVTSLTDEIELVKRQKLPGIKKSLEKVATLQLILKNALEAAPGAFVKPKTLIFHGIKVGYKKGKGKMDWEDDEQVLKLIKKFFPEQVEILINTKETPNKQALDGLDVKDLRKLGITVEETGDQVVIKAVAGDVEKLVNALLKDAVEDTTAEAV